MNSKETNFVSAVVYCHNDADTIGEFIKNLDVTLSENFAHFEIIVVNDSSSDNSVQIIKDYAKQTDNLVISILNMSITWGVEYSMNSGIDLSIGDYVFEFDTPAEDYNWNLLMEVYNTSLKGYDIVCAVNPKKRKIKNSIFYNIVNRNAGLPYKIGQTTFRVLSRRAINRVRAITKSVAFRKIAYAKCGLPLACINYNETRNVKLEHSDELILSVTTLLLYTNIGYRYTVKLSFYMFLFALLGALFSISYSISIGSLSLSIFIYPFIALCFAGLFAILAIIVRYLKTITDLVYKKKDSIFVSIEKLSNQ